MLARLFSLLGFAWARRWHAQADIGQMERWRDFLSVRDVSLEESEYAAIEAQYTDRMRAEWLRKYRKLRNEFALRGCRLAIIQHRQTLGLPLSTEEIEFAQREGLIGGKGEKVEA